MPHQVELTPELEEALAQEASERQMSISDLIQEKLRGAAPAKAIDDSEGTGEYLRSLAERFRSRIPEEERQRIPPDFAKNHRYYHSAFRKETE